MAHMQSRKACASVLAASCTFLLNLCRIRFLEEKVFGSRLRGHRRLCWHLSLRHKRCMNCLWNLVASQVAHGFEVFSEQQLLVLNDPTRVALAVLVCILDVASLVRRAAECLLGREFAESGRGTIALMVERRLRGRRQCLICE